MNNKVLIFSKKISNRLKYISNFIFKNVLETNYEITNNIENFIQYNGAKINYSTNVIENSLMIKPADLLFERGIKEKTLLLIKCEKIKNLPVLFKNNIENDFTFPFDIFSAAFFLISRYEEYLPYEGDKYNRFEAKNSFAYKNNFLDIPIVDYWCMWLKEKIQKLYPGYKFNQRKYKYINTIDVDNAYAFAEKGSIRTIGGYIKDLIKFDFDKVKYRTDVLFNKKNDPYDTFDLLLSLQRKYNIESIYFFLLADYGINDKNIAHSSYKLQSLIKTIADSHKIGIHPSFASNWNLQKLKKEIKRLENISNRDVIRSRQHFLMLKFPTTYRNIIEEGIKKDYTMGYASLPGFRASTCTPFNFFDLDMGIETPLKIYPFAVMEGTFKFYLNKTPDESLPIIKNIIEKIKYVKGTYISLWHNESLSNFGEWKNWQNLYEEMIKIAI